MRWLRRLGLVVLVVILGAALFGWAARFADGPVGPFPGGVLAAGELVRVPPADWSFATDVREVELQLEVPPRSRTTWLLVHEGRPYVPCGLPTARFFKHWPYELERDDRVVLRADGRRYLLRAVRVTDRAEWDALAALSQAKYGHGTPAYPDDVWFYRLEPRGT
jgi:hypothetical protein